MARQLSLAERHDRLWKAIRLASEKAERRRDFNANEDHVGALMTELSHDVQALERQEPEATHDDYDRVEQRLDSLLGQLQDSHDRP